jgi:hypothetical protein
MDHLSKLKTPRILYVSLYKQLHAKKGNLKISSSASLILPQSV